MSRSPSITNEPSGRLNTDTSLRCSLSKADSMTPPIALPEASATLPPIIAASACGKLMVIPSIMVASHAVIVFGFCLMIS